MAIIENGGHEGNYKLRVNSEGQATVQATVESEDRHININHEKVWSLPYEGIDPAAADDYFLYIKNTGSSNIALTDFRVESTVIGTVEVHSVTGTASSGSTLTPVNRQIGSSVSPTATIETATDITGLTSAGVLFWLNCDTADKTLKETTSSNVVIPPGQAVALLWDQSTGVMKGMVSLVEIV